MTEKPLTFVLSFVSGFIDTAGFIALNGLFVAHVTSNVVLAGVAFYEHGEGILSRLIMIPVFMLAVALTYVVSHLLKSIGVKDIFPVLLFLEACLLVAFAFTGDHFQKIEPHLSQSSIIIIGTIGITAMAIQNSFMRVHLSKFVPTTLMTGNIAQLSMDCISLLFIYISFEDNDLPEEEITQIHNRMKRVGIALSGFFIGAILGAILENLFHLLSAVLPAIILMAVALNNDFGNKPKIFYTKND